MKRLILFYHSVQFCRKIPCKMNSTLFCIFGHNFAYFEQQPTFFFIIILTYFTTIWLILSFLAHIQLIFTIFQIFSKKIWTFKKNFLLQVIFFVEKSFFFENITSLQFYSILISMRLVQNSKTVFSSRIPFNRSSHPVYIIFAYFLFVFGGGGNCVI